MPRRVRLPGADELFRSTQPRPDDDAVDAGSRTEELLTTVVDGAAQPRRGSGRVRHDEKITVYVTPDELLDLEHTRLALRREHGLAVDRGRIVREAITLAVQGVQSDGGESALVRRLRDR